MAFTGTLSDLESILRESRDQLLLDAKETADDLRWKARHLAVVTDEFEERTNEMPELVQEAGALVTIYGALADILNSEAKRMAGVTAS